MTLVATALCADRAVIANSAIRPETVPNSTLVGRLTVNLRRSVASVRLLEVRRDQDELAVVIPAWPQVCRFAPVSLSPFQFRLPPPAIA